MRLHTRYIILALLLTCAHTLLQAQGVVFQRRTARMNEPAPKALLIKINSQKARLAYTERTQNPRLAAIVKKDAAEATRRMIMDFTDNFDYCPIYYFYDTNAHKILAGNFAGALLDKDLQPATNIVLQPGDTNFFIGYYGILDGDFAVPLSKEDRLFNDKDPSDIMRKRYGHKEEEYYKHHADMVNADPTWVVLDYKFRNLRSPLPWSYFWSINTNGRTMKRNFRAYRYVSKRLNIVYRASALKYSATLDQFYGPYPYKN